MLSLPADFKNYPCQPPFPSAVKKPLKNKQKTITATKNQNQIKSQQKTQI